MNENKLKESSYDELVKISLDLIRINSLILRDEGRREKTSKVNVTNLADSIHNLPNYIGLFMNSKDEHLFTMQTTNQFINEVTNGLNVLKKIFNTDTYYHRNYGNLNTLFNNSTYDELLLKSE